MNPDYIVWINNGMNKNLCAALPSAIYKVIPVMGVNDIPRQIPQVFRKPVKPSNLRRCIAIRKDEFAITKNRQRDL